MGGFERAGRASREQPPSWLDGKLAERGERCDNETSAAKLAPVRSPVPFAFSFLLSRRTGGKTGAPTCCPTTPAACSWTPPPTGTDLITSTHRSLWVPAASTLFNALIYEGRNLIRRNLCAAWLVLQIDHDPRHPVYVAAQSPLPESASDFWQLVWEQGNRALRSPTKSRSTFNISPRHCQAAPRSCYWATAPRPDRARLIGRSAKPPRCTTSTRWVDDWAPQLIDLERRRRRYASWASTRAARRTASARSTCATCAPARRGPCPSSTFASGRRTGSPLPSTPSSSSAGTTPSPAHPTQSPRPRRCSPSRPVDCLSFLWFLQFGIHLELHSHESDGYPTLARRRANSIICVPARSIRTPTLMKAFFPLVTTPGRWTSRIEARLRRSSCTAGEGFLFPSLVIVQRS